MKHIGRDQFADFALENVSRLLQEPESLDVDVGRTWAGEVGTALDRVVDQQKNQTCNQQDKAPEPEIDGRGRAVAYRQDNE